jgi:rRNA maturation endonuclease Nob1
VMAQENEIEIVLTWEMTCLQCKAHFEVEVPRGPRDEKNLRCPHCGSEKIAIREATSESAPACGG